MLGNKEWLYYILESNFNLARQRPKTIMLYKSYLIIYANFKDHMELYLIIRCI